ncbi:MAG: diacylglycerol kinase family protein [Chloroflexi bacterium]|nr:MAG: diacylglycerol kinase family protein [Chloroflexota bacterium]TMD80755.1 MAG: diacylglycerol kinase family protein [Chloroflexota bacterium]
MTPRSDAEFEAERIGSPSRARRVDLRRTLYSFRHAGRGLAWALSSQANLRVHFVAAAVVLIAALVLRFSAIEFVGLILCFTVVVAAELFNTTLEVLIDYAWPEHHPMIGRAKDVAAAAVLMAAAGAAIVGVLLFARHIFFHLS